MSLNLSFPDSTYTTTNKPNTVTIKVDLNAIETGFNAHEASTAEHGTTGAAVGTTNSQTLTNKTLTSPVVNTQITGTAIADEDTLASNSDLKVPTQQSVKAYVDTHAADASTHGVTGSIVGTSKAQTLTNKTLTSPVINGVLTGTGGFDAWTSWNPTFGNIGSGSSVASGSYIQIGKTVHYKAKMLIGAGGGVFGSISCDLPISAKSGISVMGTAYLEDATGSFYAATHLAGNVIYYLGTNNALIAISSTAPFTWAVGDIVEIFGTFEAA